MTDPGAAVPRRASRTTGATRRRPPSRRGASRCSASCWPERCWRRHDEIDPRAERRGRRVRPPGPAGARGGRRRRAGPAAEADPDRRESLAGPVLAELGAWDLDPRADADELEAAAALCRSAGYWALAVPGGRAAGRPADLDVDGLVVVAGDVARPGPSPGVESRWAAVTLDGARSRGHAPAGARRRARRPSSPSSSSSPIDDDGRRPTCALGLVLPCWTLLGHARPGDRAHPRARARCASSSASRWRRSRACSSSSPTPRSSAVGVEELAKYALWSVETRLDPRRSTTRSRCGSRPSRRPTIVFRVAHQLHGAIGFCDETTLSWLSRYSQPLRRLPLGLSATRDGADPPGRPATA